MVVNHAGLRWLSPRDAESSLSGAMVFLGSLAPVVFFFVTGFGTALSAAGRLRPAPLGPLFLRSALLVVADQFFAWPYRTPWVLDFFSFIGLTVLVVGSPGTASIIAQALDESSLQDQEGTLAGDNTTLVLFADEARLERWLERFEEIRSQPAGTPAAAEARS